MSTHTYAIAEVSRATYDEIRAVLVAAGYQQAVHDDSDGEVLDMHGIGACRLQSPQGLRRQKTGQQPVLFRRLLFRLFRALTMTVHIVQLTPLLQQAVEVAARTVTNDKRCGVPIFDRSGNAFPCPHHLPCRGGHESPEFLLARDVVTLWLGYLLSVNDTTIDEIARAAEDAETCNGRLNKCQCHQPIPPSKFIRARGTDGHCDFCRTRPFDFPALISAFVIEAVALGSNGGKCPRRRASDNTVCSMSEIGHIGEHVGRDAKGDGAAGWTDDESVPIPSWFDEHARFTLGGSRPDECSEIAGRPLIIPPLVLDTEAA
jgi:hypothetical protein